MMLRTTCLAGFVMLTLGGGSPMQGRMYDPAIGQFMSADPIVTQPYGQGLNRFAYVNNGPFSHTDPSGFSMSEDLSELSGVTGDQSGGAWFGRGLFAVATGTIAYGAATSGGSAAVSAASAGGAAVLPGAGPAAASGRSRCSTQPSNNRRRSLRVKAAAGGSVASTRRLLFA